MRLRNVKNKEEILNNSKFLVKDYFENCGKWSSVFGNDNPIYIEIGMGKGKFIRENAKTYPNINFIGIEKYDSVVAKCLPKIDEDLENLLIIRMDALDIDKVFNKEISRIYLNFSDPWPKARHHLRRLSSRVFLEKYNSIFKNNMEIYMRTDNTDLFTYSLESFSQNGYSLYDISLDLHSSVEDENFITTEYEDRFSSKGMPIYSVVAVKDVKSSK
ncbi:MAG: tRNA (guanosine(46)-N7)-methyltransferase TrmB [Firmicutes bacterium]|nr:tRNA (guanosine(46)-N7)-methyltransferase TrmB [Bacillota bacterium]